MISMYKRTEDDKSAVLFLENMFFCDVFGSMQVKSDWGQGRKNGLP